MYVHYIKLLDYAGKLLYMYLSFPLRSTKKMRKEMIKCAENTIKVGRCCIQGEKKSTYHTQLFPHLRKAKGKKTNVF